MDIPNLGIINLFLYWELGSKPYTASPLSLQGSKTAAVQEARGIICFLISIHEAFDAVKSFRKSFLFFHIFARKKEPISALFSDKN